MIEDHLILTMIPEIILGMQETGKTGPDYSLPKSFKELWMKRKTILKKVKDGNR